MLRAASIFLALALPMVALALPMPQAGTALAVTGGCATTQYDAAFQRAAEKWWPDSHAWLILKAQACQESRLNPNAVSPANAVGLAQFLLATWNEVTAQLELGDVDRTDTDAAIEAQAYYMWRLSEGWTAPRPDYDTFLLAAASYNAGFGNILAAQRVCKRDGGGRCRDWNEIEGYLVQVTGERNSHETRTYVRRIQEYLIGYVLS